MSRLIIVAEDERNMRKLIASLLRTDGFRAMEANNGKEAIELFENNQECCLVILDVMMPEMDGYTACKIIRQQSDVPILILTARDMEEDELLGFNCGADEYISKPFSSNILLTRIRNLLKRTSESLEDVEIGSIRITGRERKVTVGSEVLILAPKEYDLLNYLVRNKNLVLTREQILTAIWGFDYYGEQRTIDTHIKCLRAKMGKEGNRIVTIRKVGYKFET